MEAVRTREHRQNGMMTKKLQKTVTGARMSPKKAKMVIKAVSSTDKL